MKNSNDTIGNRTRDLPTCSAVPQPTASPRTPVKELFAQTNSEQTQHIHKHETMIIPSSYFSYKIRKKKAQTGVDKYSSVQHISVDENNALKLQEMCNLRNSESHRSAVTRDTTFSSNPYFFTQTLTRATFVFRTNKRTSAWSYHKPLTLRRLMSYIYIYIWSTYS